MGSSPRTACSSSFALAANAFRVTLLPRLARARDAGRLGAETVAYAVAMSTVAVPLLVVAIVAAAPSRTCSPAPARPPRSTPPRKRCRGWSRGDRPVLAGLVASALAALDDYVVAAAGYVTGSVVGLA